jgi:hypothetical protein
MNLNPYAAPPGPRRLSSVSPLEWLAVIVIGAFTAAAAVACWIWLRDFP